MVSDLVDLDVAEAATEFQKRQTILQAALQSGSQILQTSLLDYL
jgi:flagellin-like hook-associated protein FlgL